MRSSSASAAESGGGENPMTVGVYARRRFDSQRIEGGKPYAGRGQHRTTPVLLTAESGHESTLGRGPSNRPLPR
jgi:hypothetical protein